MLSEKCLYLSTSRRLAMVCEVLIRLDFGLLDINLILQTGFGAGEGEGYFAARRGVLI